MTDFEKLMILLNVPKEKWDSLFDEVCYGDLVLVLDFNENGSISWSTL